MLAIPRSRVLYVVLSITVAGLLLIFTWPHAPKKPWQHFKGKAGAKDGEKWEFDYRKDGRNFGLSEDQCNAAFPGLWKEIDRAVERRRQVGKKVPLEELELGHRSSARVLVRDNQLYVIEENGATTNFRPRSLATLNSINRAVTSFSDTILPDAEFTLGFEDEPVGPGVNRTTWAYNRAHDQEDLWLMPDFGFWGWPRKGTNSYSEHLWILEELEDLEFTDKIPKVVWRGSLGNAGGGIRKALVDVSEGHEWNDVLPIVWKNETQAMERMLSMTEHCDYMFTAQTEGNTYSGRFKFLLACHSVPLTHELHYIEHFHHLLEPSGSNQNFVQLRRDFSDLPETMDRLLSRSGLEESRRIADNSRRTFRERYLTPAAEACYWRAMIRAWASVQGFEPQRWKEVTDDKDAGGLRPDLTDTKKKRKSKLKPRGVPFEAYALMEKTGGWSFTAPIQRLCDKCADEDDRT